MSIQTAQVVEFNRNRIDLPLQVILTNWVNFRNITGLPSNADCTPILKQASERALMQMFPEGKAYVETFMPRNQQFQQLLKEEVIAYKQGLWQLDTRKNHVPPADNDGIGTAMYSTPAPFPR